MKPVRRSSLRHVAVSGATALAAMLGGCTSVPDYANPVEWYNGATGAVSRAFSSTDDARGADQPYPTLGTTPGRPNPGTAGQRAAVADALVADRSNAQYTDEPQRRAAPVMVTPGSPASAPAARPTGSARAPMVAPEIQPDAPPPPQTTNFVGDDPTSTSSSPEFRSTQAPAAPPPGSGGRTLQDAVGTPAPPSTRVLPDPVEPPPTRAPAVRQTEADPVAPPAPPAYAPPNSATVQQQELPAPNRAPSRSIPAASSQQMQQMPQMAAATPAPAAPAGQQLDSMLQQTFSTPAASPRAASGTTQLATIYFQSGSANLSDGDRQVLREVARVYSQQGGSVKIIGHTSRKAASLDAMRQRLADLEISSARADAVARELVRLGVPQAAVTAAAEGSARPAFEETTAAGVAGNQRADIYLIN